MINFIAIRWTQYLQGRRSQAGRWGNTAEPASPGRWCCPRQGGGGLHEVSPTWGRATSSGALHLAARWHFGAAGGNRLDDPEAVARALDVELDAGGALPVHDADPQRLLEQIG